MRISWTAIQALHEPDLERHWSRCGDELGLDCPIEVFEELFFERYGAADFGATFRAVDWSEVAWRERGLSGMALRQVAVDGGYQHAVDEARARTLFEGLVDERPAIVEHWSLHHTWLRPPVLVTGRGYQYELLVGFTRLGLLDREEVPELRRHRVWVGTHSGRVE